MSARKDFYDFVDTVRDELPSRLHDVFNDAVDRAAQQGRHSRRSVAHSMLKRNPLLREEWEHQQQQEGLLAMFALVIGLIGGAALMYLFDPDRGERRRAMIRSQVDSAVSDVTTSLEGVANDADSWTHNSAMTAAPQWAESKAAESKAADNKTAKGKAQDAAVSDQTLQTRVKAQLGHYLADPNAVSVTVNNGNVILSGTVQAREAQPLVERVRTIPGVKNVENHLELHDTSATNEPPTTPNGNSVPNAQGGSNGTNTH